MAQTPVSLLARQVSMAAFLYYCCNVSVIADAEFDSLCQEVADRWDELPAYYQGCLGSPEDLRASGHHILISSACYFGALAWYKEVTGETLDWKTTAPWRVDAEWQDGDVTTNLMAMTG